MTAGSCSRLGPDRRDAQQQSGSRYRVAAGRPACQRAAHVLRYATALRVTPRPPRGSDGSYGPCGPAWTGRPGRPRRSRDAADRRIRGAGPEPPSRGCSRCRRGRPLPAEPSTYAISSGVSFQCRQGGNLTGARTDPPETSSPEVCSFQLSEVGSFRLSLTPVAAAGATVDSELPDGPGCRWKSPPAPRLPRLCSRSTVAPSPPPLDVANVGGPSHLSPVRPASPGSGIAGRRTGDRGHSSGTMRCWTLLAAGPVLGVAGRPLYGPPPGTAVKERDHDLRLMPGRQSGAATESTPTSVIPGTASCSSPARRGAYRVRDRREPGASRRLRSTVSSGLGRELEPAAAARSRLNAPLRAPHPGRAGSRRWRRPSTRRKHREPATPPAPAKPALAPPRPTPCCRSAYAHGRSPRDPAGARPPTRRLTTPPSPGVRVPRRRGRRGLPRGSPTSPRCRPVPSSPRHAGASHRRRPARRCRLRGSAGRPRGPRRVARRGPMERGVAPAVPGLDVGPVGHGGRAAAVLAAAM